MGGKPKALVVFGAGASHDVSNINSALITDGLPVANQLFSEYAARNYKGIINRYPGVQTLFNELISVSRTGHKGLEEQLRKYAESKDDRLRRLFAEVPLYVRDVITDQSARFSDNSGNYGELVLKLIAHEPQHDVAFVVMNYDTLLEQQLTAFDPEYRFDSLRSYIRHEELLVIKPHGSQNWLFPIGSRSQSDGWREVLRKWDGTIDMNSVSVIDGHRTMTGLAEDNTYLHPLLTLPTANKTEADIVCPPDHLSALREFWGDCHKVLIVGSSGLDEDLISVLSEWDTWPRLTHLVTGPDDAPIVRERFAAVTKEDVDPNGVLVTPGFGVYMEDPSNLAAFKAVGA